MSLHKYVRRRNPAVREYLEIFHDTTIHELLKHGCCISFILWELSVICESGNLPDSVKKELP